MPSVKRENLILGFLVLAAVIGLVGYGFSLYSKGPDLPVLRTLANFELENAHGGQFSTASLKDQVWVADFIFTRCGGTCPEMSTAMSQLQRDTADLKNVVLVSISVDPKNDSPEALTTYASQYQANRSRWHFLRGDLEFIKELTVKYFALGDKNDPLNHSNKFVLVDGHGRIRGYYDGSGLNKDNDYLRLLRDVKNLAKNPNADE